MKNQTMKNIGVAFAAFSLLLGSCSSPSANACDTEGRVTIPGYCGQPNVGPDECEWAYLPDDDEYIRVGPYPECNVVG